VHGRDGDDDVINQSRHFGQCAVDGKACHLAASGVDEIKLARELALHEGVEVESSDPQLGQILGDADHSNGTGMKDVFERVAAAWRYVLWHVSLYRTLFLDSLGDMVKADRPLPLLNDDRLAVIALSKTVWERFL